MARLRIGSRGSQLALWQANHVAALLRERGFETGIEIIKTTGDKMTEVALSQVGTKGMFTKEIEEALDQGKVDLAVHSLKDLPTELPAGFELAAIMKREDARDALVSNSFSGLSDLPQGSVVGTSSLRREAQLRALRPDLKVVPLRGNVDSRLRKAQAGEFGAIVVAHAGLLRLRKQAVAREVFEAARICPAAGQGALGIEIRAGDSRLLQAVQFLDDKATRRCTDCERSLLRSLGGGCQVPIGAFAELRDGRLHLTARVGSQDGTQMLSEEMAGDDAQRLGGETGEKLLRRGADAILKEIYGSSAAAPGQP